MVDLDLDGIEKVIVKLENDDALGSIERVQAGRAEIRYSYFLKDKMAFTFGLTRSSKAKEKTYYYVPRQMHITNKQYKGLHDCPWSKADYNAHLLSAKIV